ncbi:MAG: GNAT family N-acetyltransferase [Anaerolineales bacterium]|nr:GNAT family N-acetyltransferase [Anaerolineales bacterium]
MSANSIQIHPATSANWDDLETLFGEHGADAGCWCMFWRLRHKDYAQGTPETNKLAHKQMLAEGRPTGLLAYLDGKAVGWCGVSPRAAFARLDSSKLIPSTQEKTAWSVICLFVDGAARGQGAGLALLNEAANFARAHGASLLEAYPAETLGKKLPAKRAYAGTVALFKKAGFEPIAATEARIQGFERWIVQRSL